MRFLSLLSVFIFFISCKKNLTEDQKLPSAQDIMSELKDNADVQIGELEQLFDSFELKGSIIIQKEGDSHFHGWNINRWDSGFLPASTYKIVNSMIGLDCGAIHGLDHSFEWNGEKRRMEQWEKTMDLKEAYGVSCVPCYQELAGKIGVDRMNEYLQKIEYPGMIVDTTNLKLFWLTGESRITSREQLKFYKRFWNEEIDIQDRTYDMMKELMLLDSNENYRLYGKTGWSIRDGFNVGWFVGMIHSSESRYYFVTNVEPINESGLRIFGKSRLLLSLKCMQQLGYI